MELLRGTAPKVKFYGPTPGTEIDTVTYSVNGVEPIPGEAKRVAEKSEWTVQLPYLQADVNDIEVVWHFTIEDVQESFEETFSYEVVTPYLTKQEVLAILDDDTVSDDDVWEVEAAVRHIINAHTGQKFGYDRDKTLTVEGHGETALYLPERLVTLTGVATIRELLDPRSIIVVSDGWYIKKRWTETIGRRDVDNFYFGEDSRPNGVIYAPSVTGRASVWRDDYPFEITGDWGYKTVPAAVKEAARLLLNDYACQEIAYRDRYLESIKAADWRLQFNSQAWQHTGNVRADQLLSEFVLMEWRAI